METIQTSQNLQNIVTSILNGVEAGQLVDTYGQDEWSEALLLLAKNEVDENEHKALLDALACHATDDYTLSKVLISLESSKAQQGQRASGRVRTFDELIQRGRRFDEKITEKAWLDIGRKASRLARESTTSSKMSWAQVDAADRLLASLEPWVGLAPELRLWACSADCALPNTTGSFRRGQLKISAAKTREGKNSAIGESQGELIQKTNN